MWDTDIGNAYLEAKTIDRVFIVEGTEFGYTEGPIIIVSKV